jgi:hypothetical protein
MVDQPGKSLPEAKASAVLQLPATIPFKQAINIASLVDTLRVRLLSTAQQAQAATINSAPVDILASPDCLSTAVGFLANLVSATFRPPFAAESADYFELPLS